MNRTTMRGMSRRRRRRHHEDRQRALYRERDILRMAEKMLRILRVYYANPHH